MKKTYSNCFILGLLMFCASVSSAGSRISPVGGDVLRQGKYHTIRWDKRINPSAQNVSIWLWDGGQAKWRLIAENVALSAGSYEWNIPSELSGSRFRLQFRYADGSTNDMNRTYFSIAPPELKQNTSSVRNGKFSSVKNSLLVSPNPSSGIVSFKWNGNARNVIVRNALGAVVQETSVDTNQRLWSLQKGGLSAGIYFVEVVYVDGRIERQNFIFQ